MIIPLELKMEKRDAPESFGDEVSFGQPLQRPTYRVEAIVLDTEQVVVRRYVWHALVDAKQPEHSSFGYIEHRPADLAQLRKVRDEIDKLLEEESDGAS